MRKNFFLLPLSLFIVIVVDCLPSLAFLHLASPVSESFHRKILKHPTVLSMQSSSLQSEHQRIQHQQKPDRKDPAIVVHPHWFEGLKSIGGSKIVEVQEWQDHNWRESDGGFHGHDFCHSSASAVRILDYILVPPSPAKEEEPAAEFPMLVGAVHFSPRAESHRGLCHGGSMCAVMDDAIGWCGFCSSVKGGDDEFLVRPWNGFTVQVNTALLKPVPVGAMLRLEARVMRKEGARKHWIEAQLMHPETREVHCRAEGLFLLNKEEVKE